MAPAPDDANGARANNLHLVGTVNDLNEDEPLAIQAGDERIAIFQVGDAYFATQNICPHAYAILTTGFYHEGIIECPLHQSSFDVRTGRCLGGPADRDLKCYPVRREGDSLYLESDVV